MQSTWLDRLERKIGRFSIPNLMNLILVGMAVVFVSDLFLFVQYDITLSQYLYFDRNAIFHGEVWRILSFLFIPVDSSPLWILFSIYFYWLIGNGLERQWGSFRFNVFYFCGIIGTILSGLITGYVGNTYLNLSLFLAFALLYPDFQVMLFFILPVKMKWLAWLDVAFLLIEFIVTDWSGRLSILFAFANILLFFGKDFWQFFQSRYRRYQYRRKMK